jgi:hypothetical protein
LRCGINKLITAVMSVEFAKKWADCRESPRKEEEIADKREQKTSESDD